MTVVLRKTKIRSVQAKGPKVRKLKSASELQESSQDSRVSREKVREKSPDTTRQSQRTQSLERAQSGTRNGAAKSQSPRKGKRRPGLSGQFILYVEGARDREILGCWARRLDVGLARYIEKNTVILGGRRPARAISDFRKRGGVDAGFSGLIVLDRDDHPHAASGSVTPAENGDASSLSTGSARVEDGTAEAGLELFVWGLRHIESYLLVPAAIRRMLGLGADDRRVERSIDESAVIYNGGLRTSGTPTAQHTAQHTTLHAKRILGSGGALSEALGTELRAGEIARAMRLDELHGDVHRLFDRIGRLSGLSVKGPEVVIRSRAGFPRK